MRRSRRTTWCGNRGVPTRVPMASSSRGGSARCSPSSPQRRLQPAPRCAPSPLSCQPKNKQAQCFWHWSRLVLMCVASALCFSYPFLLSSIFFPAPTFRLDAFETLCGFRIVVSSWIVGLPKFCFKPTHLPFFCPLTKAMEDCFPSLFVVLCTIYLLVWNKT